MRAARRLIPGWTLTLASLALLGSPAGAQLLPIAYDLVDNEEVLLRISSTSGALTELGPIAGFNSTSGPVVTSDPAARRVYFVGNDGAAVPRIYTIHSQTGVVLNNPALAAGNEYIFLEREPLGGTLYLAYRNIALNEVHLATVSPTTGALANQGAAVANCCGTYNIGLAALGGNVFYFIATTSGSGTDWRLWKITLTGSATNALLPVGAQYQMLEYNPVTGVLYTVYRPGASVTRLATVNPATGALTDIGPGIAACCGFPNGPLGGLSTDRVYFIASFDSSSDRNLFNLRTADGVGANTPAFSSSYLFNYVAVLAELFWDGFESGNTNRWSAVAP